MTDFVRDDIRLREISRRIELAPQLFIKPKIDVNPLIARTIEWTNSSTCDPTRRAHLIRKQHQRRLAILPAVLTKHVGPNVFRLRQDHRDKLFQLVLLRILWTRALHARLLLIGRYLLEQLLRIHTESSARIIITIVPRPPPTATLP